MPYLTYANQNRSLSTIMCLASPTNLCRRPLVSENNAVWQGAKTAESRYGHRVCCSDITKKQDQGYSATLLRLMGLCVCGIYT